jgi:hypothetical protein
LKEPWFIFSLLLLDILSFVKNLLALGTVTLATITGDLTTTSISMRKIVIIAIDILVCHSLI